MRITLIIKSCVCVCVRVLMHVCVLVCVSVCLHVLWMVRKYQQRGDWDYTIWMSHQGTECRTLFSSVPKLLCNRTFSHSNSLLVNHIKSCHLSPSPVGVMRRCLSVYMFKAISMCLCLSVCVCVCVCVYICVRYQFVCGGMCRCIGISECVCMCMFVLVWGINMCVCSYAHVCARVCVCV